MSHDALGHQFLLFHGTNEPNMTVVSRSHDMKNHKMQTGTFSTTDIREALGYAHSAVQQHGGIPVVHQVVHEPGDIEPDPMANPFTWGPEHDTLEEAFEHVQAGGNASFRHLGDLHVVHTYTADEAEDLAREWG